MVSHSGIRRWAAYSVVFRARGGFIAGLIVGVIVRRAVAAGVDHGSPRGTPPTCTSAEGLPALASVSQLSQARRSSKPGMRGMARCDAALVTAKYDSIYLNE